MSAARQRSGWRRGLGRVLRILVAALSPFLLVELGMRVVGYYPPEDPYLVGFAEDEPIFVREGEQLVVAPEKRRTWRALPFPAEPTPGVLRVFSVGDSVTWGHRGNEFPTPLKAYSEVLEELLRQRLPGAPHRVVNCGARTFATTRGARVVREVLAHAPDVVIVYVGTSEHLEGQLRVRRRWQQEQMPGWLRDLRLVGALLSLLRPPSRGLELSGLSARDPALRASFLDASAWLPYPGGRERLLDHARANLDAIVEACRARDVPLVLATVASHLRYAPFATRFEPPSAQAEGEAVLERTGELLAGGHADQAFVLLEAALSSHQEAAGLHYRMAQAREALGDTAGARESYRAARDTDACPLRALGPFNEHVRRLAREHPGVFLADIERLLEAAVPDGIPDERVFLDNSHPDPAAHRLIAEELYRVLREAGLVAAP